MEVQERELVLQQLASSEARLLGLVDGLSEAQWTFRETPERWSIAGIVEHCALFEGFILGKIVAVIEAGPEPEKRVDVEIKEGLVMGLAQARATPFVSREIVRPTGAWSQAKAVAELRAARAKSVAFATETEAPLRDCFFAHIAFGDLDCCQWLLLLGQHMERHVLQVEEVMADAEFPVSLKTP